MNEPASKTTKNGTQAAGGDFTETQWTQVMLAGGPDRSAAARQALEALCARYWRPIYSFLRHQGHRPPDAEDLTQSFFGRLIEQNTLLRADRSKGRFRSFLLGALKRFLVDETRRNRAQKRGGGQAMLSLDFQGVEARYLEEADPGLTPEQAYDRRWAATVLESAFAELQAQFQAAGQLARFVPLKKFLSAPPGDGEYEAVAARLNVTPNAVAAAVRRLRERYRELVRRDVKTTVINAEGLETELRELFQ